MRRRHPDEARRRSGKGEIWESWGLRFRVQGSGFRVSPWGGAPFDYVRNRFGGFNRFRGFNGGGAAHKNMEAPRSIDGGDARRWHFSH